MSTRTSDPTSKATQARLGDLLVQKGTVSRHDVDQAVSQQTGTGKKVGQLLVELGVLAERDLAEAVASQTHISLVDLRQEQPQEEAIAKIPESVARQYDVLALRITDGKLCAVFADPTESAIEAVRNAAGQELSIAIAPTSEIRRAIHSAYRALTSLDQHVSLFEEANLLRKQSAAASRAGDDSATDNAPVVKIVTMITTQALRDRASDIHIEPQDDRIRVRFRIDGALQDVVALPSAIGPALVSRLKVLAGMNIVEKRRPQDGQIALTIEGQSVDIRVSTTATIWGEKAVLRVLDKSRALYSLNNLGMSETTHTQFSELIKAPFGMVICAGPTGSGKTTTLYAALAEINRPERNIMTIEDPVEYIVPSINQIQINEQAGISFAGGLKSILRQDPDVILVGEIRDVETARIAVQSALTGHFVLSSLHATDAVSALQRFLDMGLESFLIVSSVSAVVGQRLLRRICTSCKVSYKPNAEELAFYKQSNGTGKAKFFRGEGCNFCAQTGYQDRIGIYEVLVITEEVKQAILGSAAIDDVRKIATAQGMRSLRDEATRLVDADLTTISEVIRTVYTL